MGLPARRAAWLWRLVVVGLVFASAAPRIVDDSGPALPLLMSSLVLLSLTIALALAALVPHLPAIASGGQVRHCLVDAGHSVRQRDPDAAGHTRPRAPGQAASGSR